MINRFQRDKSTLRGGVFAQRRAARELSASYWSFLGCIARVSSRVTLEGGPRRWRKGIEGTREEEEGEEEAEDLTI